MSASADLALLVHYGASGFEKSRKICPKIAAYMNDYTISDFCPPLIRVSLVTLSPQVLDGKQKRILQTTQCIVHLLAFTRDRYSLLVLTETP